MHLHEAIKKVFHQVSDVLDELSCEQYAHASKALFNASIGQHVRHIIELFIELEKGYVSGVVNYEKRERDSRIETNRLFAKEALWSVWNLLNKEDKELMLELDYSESSAETISVQSNYYRELIYNLEHTIHHMALIRIGVNDVAEIKVPDNFGVASSTIKHYKACAQ